MATEEIKDDKKSKEEATTKQVKASTEQAKSESENKEVGAVPDKSTEEKDNATTENPKKITPAQQKKIDAKAKKEAKAKEKSDEKSEDKNKGKNKLKISRITRNMKGGAKLHFKCGHEPITVETQKYRVGDTFIHAK